MFRNNPIHPHVFLRIGLGAFALSGLLHLFVHPAGRAAQDWLDAARGFSVGVLIASFGLAAWKKRTATRG
jgi:hypothetical protein